MKKTAWPIAFMFFSVIAFSQKISRYPRVTIGELTTTTADTVLLNAYILDIYVCPPCPEGMQCKPCIENNFTALDKKPADIMKVPQNQKLRVYTEHPDLLKVGHRYLLTVRLRNKNTSPADQVELVAFEPR